jgi:hypothetical protein
VIFCASCVGSNLSVGSGVDTRGRPAQSISTQLAVLICRRDVTGKVLKQREGTQ